MNKKLYIRPTIEVVRIETTQMLAGSMGNGAHPYLDFTNPTVDNTGYEAD